MSPLTRKFLAAIGDNTVIITCTQVEVVYTAIPCHIPISYPVGVLHYLLAPEVVATRVFCQRRGMAQLVLHSLHSAAHASAISCRARLGSAPQQTLARQHLRLFSAQIPGPIERKFREEFVNYSPPPEIDPTVIRPSPDGKKLYS